MEFPLPRITKNDNGVERQVGLEFEFSGLTLKQSSELLAKVYQSASVTVKNEFLHTVEVPDVGEFQLEIDSIMLKNKQYEDHLKKIGIDISGSEVSHTIATGLARFSEGLVPKELVTPPIPLSKLSTLEEVREQYHRAGAKGTQSSWTAGFGLHINIESPDTKASTVLAYLQSFILLYEWICKKSNIDLTRRVLPYIKEFPKDYATHILDLNYQPTEASLVADYLKFNPTRNRALDLLPIFKHMNPKLLQDAPIEHDLVKPRPAYHYRLPNCSIGNPKWQIADEWRYWIKIDDLANEPDQLHRLQEAYIQLHRTQSLDLFSNDWIAEVDRCLPS